MRQEKDESRIMELPRDLMFVIFVMLECKDILSCKCVCRAWYNFLSDPNFSTIYARYSPLLTFLVTHHTDYSDYFFLIHVSANGGFIRRPIKPKLVKSSKRRSNVSVIGSCNGLLFFLLCKYKDTVMTQKVYFGNPLLGKYDSLREFKSVNKRVNYEEYKVGFVPATNKIKLLRIGFYDDGRVQEAHILTFREDDEWRKLKDPLTHFFQFTRGTCFNGAYHWVGKNVDWIFTFDFEEEKCGRISKPRGLLQLSCEMRMAVLNNCLCLIEQKYGFDNLIIWTMKEYGVAKSWSKNILLNTRFGYDSLWRRFPFAVLPNGDILFVDMNRFDLLSFSPKTKLCNSVKFHDGHPKTNTSYAGTYAPRFYALEEDFSGRKCWGTWKGSCFCVHKLWNKLGF